MLYQMLLYLFVLQNKKLRTFYFVFLLHLSQESWLFFFAQTKQTRHKNNSFKSDDHNMATTSAVSVIVFVISLVFIVLASVALFISFVMVQFYSTLAMIVGMISFLILSLGYFLMVLLFIFIYFFLQFFTQKNSCQQKLQLILNRYWNFQSQSIGFCILSLSCFVLYQWPISCAYPVKFKPILFPLLILLYVQYCSFVNHFFLLKNVLL